MLGNCQGLILVLQDILKNPQVRPDVGHAGVVVLDTIKHHVGEVARLRQLVAKAGDLGDEVGGLGGGVGHRCLLGDHVVSITGAWELSRAYFSARSARNNWRTACQPASEPPRRPPEPRAA